METILMVVQVVLGIGAIVFLFKYGRNLARNAANPTNPRGVKLVAWLLLLVGLAASINLVRLTGVWAFSVVQEQRGETPPATAVPSPTATFTPKPTFTPLPVEPLITATPCTDPCPSPTPTPAETTNPVTRPVGEIKLGWGTPPPNPEPIQLRQPPPSGISKIGSWLGNIFGFIFSWKGISMLFLLITGYALYQFAALRGLVTGILRSIFRHGGGAPGP